MSICSEKACYLQKVCSQVHEVPDAEPSPGAILDDSAGLDVEERGHAKQGCCFHRYRDNAPVGGHKLSQAQRIILVLKKGQSGDNQVKRGAEGGVDMGMFWSVLMHKSKNREQ